MTFFTDLDGLLNIQAELNKIFDETIGKPQRNIGLYERGWKLPADLFENSDEFLVKADLPGFDKDNIEISIINNTLSIKAKRDPITDDEAKRYYRRERFVGQTQRNITFPVKIDRERLSAVYKNGVLEIHCPKAEEQKPKQICIECD